MNEGLMGLKHHE